MNTFGRVFKVGIFGESHGPAVGVVIDGVKAGLPLCEEDFMSDILRRKSGARGTTPRTESDEPRIISGVHDGHTTGAPVAVIFQNGNTRSGDYESIRDIPRPGHADYVASVKWNGFNDPRGGGHFSGRLTLPLVAAGVIAKKMCPGRIEASLVEIGGEPDRTRWDAMLDGASREGDSLGGIVECRVEGLPAGLGEPFFDSVESLLSHAVFSIPGVRGIEFGDGFSAARMTGSQHNDPFVRPEDGKAGSRRSRRRPRRAPEEGAPGSAGDREENRGGKNTAAPEEKRDGTPGDEQKPHHRRRRRPGRGGNGAPRDNAPEGGSGGTDR